MAKKVSPPREADPEGDLAFLAKNIPKEKENPVKKGLSNYIGKRYATLYEEFKPVRRSMVRNMKRVRGEYDEKKLQLIRAFRGSEIYVRSLENKARAAESWLKDIYLSDGDAPFVLEPTAVPDIPGESLEAIKAMTRQRAIQVEQELVAVNGAADRTEIAKMMQEFYDQEVDKERARIEQKAKDRCDRAAQEIRDQSQEGGFIKAFSDFLYWFVRVEFGVLKGPVLVKKPKLVWQVTEEGKVDIVTTDVEVNDVYAVSPFNILFQREMSNINDGDVIEIHELSADSLYRMLGVPGYSDDEINFVIAKLQNGSLKERWFALEDETQVRRVTREVKNESGREEASLKSNISSKVYAMEFSGTVSGKLLMEWGVPQVLEPNRQYQANCWKIDGHVIKAVINPDALNRKPYHVSSWAKNPSWVVGEGMVAFGGPVEDAMNAVLRALQNNVGIASGPLCEIDKDRVEPGIPLYPWRQIESTSMQMRTQGPAVNYYQPQMHAQELTLVYAFLEKLLDNLTVPAYTQGASQAGVTSGTATVYTSLLAAAARSIKAVAANIDEDIIIPYNQMCYDYNMKNTTDEQSRGDARIVAKGVAGLQAREQAAQRKIEYLQVTANPVLQTMLGEKNIGAVLAQIAKANDIKLPDMGRLEGKANLSELIMTMLSAQAGVQEGDPLQAGGQVGRGGGAPAKAVGINPDGSKAGVNNG